ncbi:TolC family protein [Aquabacterium sp. OR-4]|uniref:TolC family protein n=1 Tax=Aquabacterium sp. OR-4 TaxID=2978127 RepID=UPI0021B2E24F|nr:TolC family protein [Aquabacterium sp. OR-4]MDT7837843.1 TolC family protein [Aquabacterium sp. OR-4]
MRRSPSISRPGPWATLGCLAAIGLLSGCATLAPDAGLGPVADTVRRHTGAELPALAPAAIAPDGEAAAIAERAQALLARPLTAEAAVQLALVQHRGLRARLHDLAIADARAVQATRLPNPGVSFARLLRGDEREYERGLHVDLARWLAQPWLREAGRRQQAQLQAQVAADLLAHAADTRRAWVRAVAAQEQLLYARQVLDAADAGAELARRMQQAGNWSALQRAREQAFHADAQLGLARATQQRDASRERLLRLLALDAAQRQQLQLPERLPPLPAQARALPDLARAALDERLDLQAARAEAEALSGTLGLAQATRWLNVLELGVVHNGSNEAPTQRGFELSLELPIFDSGDARLAAAEHRQRQAVLRVAAVAQDARSELHEAWGHYRSAWDIARHHRDALVPLKARIGQEMLLRYNGMLVGVFELLADARAQIAGVSAALEAQRDFWLADIELDAARVGRPMLASATGASAAAAVPAATPDAAGH